ncbi:hypothetical protein DID80_03735 [Candidatus Marinamargulisbacteria bacterium SCGC AAA071-K20]|nr:hypothetical protein DID80_03735 [Candidatus Marinamargulisbacteria bacterium SCGC AAA071-K20]
MDYVIIILIQMTQQLTIILPTYNEVENVSVLIPLICKFLAEKDLTYSLLVVDDNSPDGTADKVRELARSYPVELIVRTKNRSLSRAVIEGFLHSKSEVCVVMDADGSHPYESLLDMVSPVLDNTCLISVGVRYVDDGDTTGFSFFRKVISVFSGLLAKGLTSISDPTSGFMAVRRNALTDLTLDPIGWKIVLEVIVKLDDAELVEVPIKFKDRLHGQSKLSMKESNDYLKHLLKLYIYKYFGFFQFIKFGLVGLCGVALDLLIVFLTTQYFKFSPELSASSGFCFAVTLNYGLHRLWTFKRSQTPYLKGLVKFIVTCLGGLSIRLLVVTTLVDYPVYGVPLHYLIVNLIGIGNAFLFNYFISKYLVFKSKKFPN